MLNWYVGWAMLLSAFTTGAVIGLFFHREDFFGGYGSFKRRVLRLGHIALAALGLVNVVFAASTTSFEPSRQLTMASLCFVIGGCSMPLVCFLTAWRSNYRRLFFIPVTALILAVIQTLRIGTP